MSANKEEVYSYSYLFVVTLFFSALASGIFLFYLLVRESFWIPYEPVIVGIALCILFSGLGQRLSKVNEIGRWILFVSSLTSILDYEIFVAPTIINLRWSNIIGYSIGFFIFVWYVLGESLNRSWAYLCQRKINKKLLAVIIGGSLLASLAIFLVSAYYTTIVSFFDSHPWAMTLIGVLITLVGGIIIGRRTKKS